MVKGFEAGYLIGLIVGEGTFTQSTGHPTLSVKLHENDPIPLLALKRVFGGKLYGPYHHLGQDGTTRHYRVWHLRGKHLRRALPVIARFLPSSHKRDQFELWVERHHFQGIAGATQREMFVVEHSKKEAKLRVVKGQQETLAL